MAAANCSSGPGPLRPDCSHTSNGTFFRVTVDNVLTFDFPTLSGAEAFAADYGPGCDISRQILPEPAADDPVACGEDVTGINVTEAVASTGYKLIYHGETIFTDPDEFVCILLRQKLGVGVVAAIRPGETVDVSDHWKERIEQTLAIRAGRGHWDDGSLPIPPEPRQPVVWENEDWNFPDLHPISMKAPAASPAPEFRFDPAWLDEDDGDDPEDQDEPLSDVYLPTLEEIATTCAEIRRGWDEQTYRSRTGQIGVARIAKSRFMKVGAQ